MKIEVINLSKRYGKKTALQNLNFLIEEPKIYGLLGKNGAGKTTFMELLSGLMRASSGELLVDGVTPFDNQRMMENICFVGEANNFKKELKVKHVLNINRLFYPTWDHSLAEELIANFNLDMDTKVKALSKGMESALGIVVGLASKAAITIFDEPYIGLDASSRSYFYELLIEHYDKYPRTIILSTHLIDEVSALFEEVIILENGQLLLKEEAETLRESCFSISGERQEINNFTAEKKVIYQKDFMNERTVVLLDEDRTTIENAGFSIHTVSLQDLIVYLTDKKREVKQ
ncbi:ABC transporter ATP-binding protein [Paraliobacillus ryukyuensis]|uniref:ABC transporter ATP-binding protein n=1 Tax=Paraliobacillus ryukyuensis TaxID=200904 RepID=UPI0009A79558|nr:ABC transporter ATP-binding protein [Paraliobacillus ryukyuensis]